MALDPSKAITQYVRRSWSVQHGLPQDSIQSITQTKDGYIWLATQEGLVRFDGSRFDVYDTSNVPSFGGNNVTCIYRDQDGTLWIATPGSVTTYRNGKFESAAKRKGLNVFAIAAEPQSRTVWFGATGGLFRLRGNQLVLEERGPKEVYALAVHDGALWIGAGDGLYRRESETIRKMEGLTAPTYVLYGSPDALWIGGQGGLRKYDGQKFHNAVPGLEKAEVWALNIDRHGMLWIGTRDGLWRWSDGQLSHLGSKQGLAHDFVNAIFEDVEGALWVGTHLGGVTLLYDGIFVSYTSRDGLADDTAWTVAQARDGAIWAGTERGGLHRFYGGVWQRVPASTGLHDKLITSLAPTGDGALWVGTYTSGLHFMNGRSVRSYDKEDGLPVNFVTALLIDRKGLLWVGTEGGLATFDGRRFKTYDPADGLPNHMVLSLGEDSRGRIWAAIVNGGIRMFDGTKFVSTVDGHRLPSGLTVSILADRSGDVWFGTRTGLYRLHAGGVFHYTRDHGLPGGTISQIQEDHHGFLWLGCSTGIRRVQRKALDDILYGRAKTAHTVLYGVTDGLPAAELSYSVYPGAWRAMDGRIWVATAKGVTVLDPRAVPPALHSRPLVEHVRVDGSFLPPDQPLVMKPEQERVEFRYSIPTFIVQDRVRFRYRLEGFDRNWIDAGDRRVAEYTNLPPGRYRFRVQAAEDGRTWISAMSMVQIDRLPAIYQTRWFLLLCLAAGLSLAGFAHYRRMRALRLRHELIHAERRRIALEFHDTLAHGLTGAILHIESALQGIADHPRAAEHLQTGKGLVRSTLAEAQRMLFNLRASSLETSHLGAAFQSMMEGMTKDLPIAGKVIVEGKPRKLRDPVLENHLLRIGQEAVTNALRHAHAKNITLGIAFEPKKVVITVRDDGRGSGGFRLEEMAANSTHGLRGMQERADQIHAKLTSHTSAGGGLEIVVEVNA